MFPILTPEQTNTADKTAMDIYGIPSIVLMENAARSSAKLIQKIIFGNEFNINKIAILCGSGNNGGDGFAIARHLFEIFDIEVFWIGNRDKMSNETKSNLDIITNLGLSITHLSDTSHLDLTDFDCIIDSLIGIGGSENISGLSLDILKIVSTIDSLKIAIDVPTGLNALNGLANEFCFEADYTITMFAEKTGLRLNYGLKYSGEIIRAYLGAPDFITEEISEIFALEPEDLEIYIPKRNKLSSKFDYGKSLIIAGSYKFSGAAALSANACAMSGSGLTYLFTPQIHSSLFPEVITIRNNPKSSSILDMSDFEFLKEEINNYDAVAIGPGLGDNQETIELVAKILELNLEIPLIIDADAIRAIDINKTYQKNYILTPHLGEFSRLINISREEIIKNPTEITKVWANKLNCTILLKGQPSIITDGDSTFWNVFGNPSLAKGGTGDVLTGIITAFAAKYIDMNYTLTTAISVLVHSLAADNFVTENSEETLLASDIIRKLCEILP